VNIVITEIAPNCSSIVGGTFPYDGNPHGAAGSCKDINGNDLPGLDLGASFTDVPGGPANWTFTSANVNYTNSSGSVDIVITAIPPDCSSIVGASYVYDTNAHVGTGSCKDLGGNPIAGLTWGTGQTNVPGGLVSWSFTSTNPNYLDDPGGSVQVDITPAPADCSSVAGATYTYDGDPHVGTGSCKDLGGNPIAGLTWGTGQTNVPGGLVSWSFTSANPNYANNPGGNVTVTIDKRTLTASIIGDPTKVYDGNANATLTPANFSIGNLVSGQSVTVTKTTGTYNTNQVLTANTGSTTLAVGDFTAGGSTNLNNYTLPTGASGAGHISPKAATWTTNPNSKLFGQLDPVPLTTGSGGTDFLPADGVTATYTRVLGELVGTYQITATLAPAGVLSNYAITNNGALFTIGSWTLNGFYQPVGIPNTYFMLVPPSITWNTIKGGQTVPLKFNLFAGTVEQTNVAAIALFTAQDFPCNAVPSAGEDVIEITTTGGTSLRYSGTPGIDGQFIQNWQAPKAPDKCYRVVMKAQDGSYLVSFFKTKK